MTEMEYEIRQAEEDRQEERMYEEWKAEQEYFKHKETNDIRG